MDDTHVHALDYLKVFRRRKWWLVLPIAASVVAGAVLVKVLPKQYRSAATVGVTAPMVSPSFVRTQPLDNQERLRAISQELTSAPILSRVVREEGIGDGRLTEALAVKLRSAINITVPDPVATTNEPRRLDSFIVAYTDSAPARAQQIANRLVNVFVDENSRAREEQAQGTSAFLSAQLQDSQARLDVLEAKLRKAKESHIGTLPEQTPANLQTLNGLRQQLDATSTSLRSEQDRLSVIERQLDAVRTGSSNVLLLSRNGEPTGTPESRIATLERELATARQMYTDKYPEVQRLTEELAQARATAAQDRQRPPADREAQLNQDPGYRQLAADRQMSQLRIADLRRAETDTRRQIAMYQGRVEAAPMVEQQLASVQREYDLEKTAYSDLANKKHQAEIAENVERDRGGEQFTVLNSAAYPLAPTSPIAWRVMLVSILVGICLAGGMTFAREYLDRSVHDVRDIKDEFEIPVLGEVANIQAA